MGNVTFQNGSNYAEGVSDQNPFATASGHRKNSPHVCNFVADNTESSPVDVPSGYRLARIEAGATWIECDVTFMGSVGDNTEFREANDMAGELITVKVKTGALCHIAPVEGVMIGADPRIILNISTAQAEAQVLKLWFVAI